MHTCIHKHEHPTEKREKGRVRDKREHGRAHENLSEYDDIFMLRHLLKTPYSQTTRANAQLLPNIFRPSRKIFESQFGYKKKSNTKTNSKKEKEKQRKRHNMSTEHTAHTHNVEAFCKRKIIRIKQKSKS